MPLEGVAPHTRDACEGVGLHTKFIGSSDSTRPPPSGATIRCISIQVWSDGAGDQVGLREGFVSPALDIDVLDHLGEPGEVGLERHYERLGRCADRLVAGDAQQLTRSGAVSALGATCRMRVVASRGMSAAAMDEVNAQQRAPLPRAAGPGYFSPAELDIRVRGTIEFAAYGFKVVLWLDQGFDVCDVERFALSLVLCRPSLFDVSNCGLLGTESEVVLADVDKWKFLRRFFRGHFVPSLGSRTPAHATHVRKLPYLRLGCKSIRAQLKLGMPGT
jgi:hypothetical protein